MAKYTFNQRSLYYYLSGEGLLERSIENLNKNIKPNASKKLIICDNLVSMRAHQATHNAENYLYLSLFEVNSTQFLNSSYKRTYNSWEYLGSKRAKRKKRKRQNIKTVIGKKHR